MRQITEVLRLNAQELSYRQIAQSVGISASTVQSYLERAQRAGLSWPLPVDLDEAAIEAQLFTRTEEELRPGRPEPDWLDVHRRGFELATSQGPRQAFDIDREDPRLRDRYGRNPLGQNLLLARRLV